MRGHSECNSRFGLPTHTVLSGLGSVATKDGWATLISLLAIIAPVVDQKLWY